MSITEKTTQNLNIFNPSYFNTTCYGVKGTSIGSTGITGFTGPAGLGYNGSTGTTGPIGINNGTGATGASFFSTGTTGCSGGTYTGTSRTGLQGPTGANEGFLYLSGGTCNGQVTNITNIFSTTYLGYHLNFNVTNEDAIDQEISLRYISNATGTTGPYYFFGINELRDTTNSYSVQQGSYTGISLCNSSNTSYQQIDIDLYNPSLASVSTRVTYNSVSRGLTGYMYYRWGLGQLGNAQTDTGVQLVGVSGNLKGTYNIYGYKQF